LCTTDLFPSLFLRESRPKIIIAHMAAVSTVKQVSVKFRRDEPRLGESLSKCGENGGMFRV
jgi:hypothetical protein